MKTKIRHSKILFSSLFLLIVLSACSTFSSKKEPPHFGVFLYEEEDYIEMEMFEAFGGEPEDNELATIPTTSDSRPVIIFWDTALVTDYLRLRSSGGGGEEVAFDISQGDTEGTLNMRPSSQLYPDNYCFIQGNPLGVFLRTWCFKVGGSQINENEVENPESSDLSTLNVDVPSPSSSFMELCTPEQRVESAVEGVWLNETQDHFQDRLGLRICEINYSGSVFLVVDGWGACVNRSPIYDPPQCADFATFSGRFKDEAKRSFDFLSQPEGDNYTLQEGDERLIFDDGTIFIKVSN